MKVIRLGTENLKPEPVSTASSAVGPVFGQGPLGADNLEMDRNE